MERVDANIAQVEAEIQQSLYKLGQIYYEEHKADGDTGDKYCSMVEAISKLELNRIGFQKNKLRLQGQMMCENCGAIIPYGSIFCSMCGQKADEKQEGGAAVHMAPGKNVRCAARLWMRTVCFVLLVAQKLNKGDEINVLRKMRKRDRDRFSIEKEYFGLP